MAIAKTYPPIPVGAQVIVLATQLLGILANIFFLYILLRHHRGWNPGKMLLLAFHVPALLFLLCVFLPLVVVMSTGRDLTPAQCTAPVLINQGASCALPLSLGVAAHFRRKTVQSTLRVRQAPNVKRYLCIMLAFVFGVVALVNATSNGVPFEWNGPLMLCVCPGLMYLAILNLILFVTVPYVIHCYRNVFTVIRTSVRDGGAEIPIMVYRILLRINFTYIALSPVVSIMTIPRYRAIASNILRCQTHRMTGSTRGLTAQSAESSKMTIRSHPHNSMTSSAPIEIAVAPGTKDMPVNETETSTVSV